MVERLRLYYPLDSFFINQKFGENTPCVRNFGLSTQSIVNGDNDITCPVGYEKLYAKFGMSGHNGMDLRAQEIEVRAAHDGVVVEKQVVPARGLGLGILTNGIVNLDSVGEHYAKTRYWHLKTMFVEVGDTVKAGQVIGITDNTGYSSGNHLHFELNAMDKDSGGHPYQAFPDNGIGGAQDPAPFFTGIYAKDVAAEISFTQQLILILSKIVDILKQRQANVR